MIEPMVMCADGPHASTWWFESDWNKLVLSSQRMLDATGSRLAPLDYIEDGTYPHPVYADDAGNAIHGKRMVYRP